MIFVETFISVLACENAVYCWHKELQLNRWWSNKSKISPVAENYVYFKNQLKGGNTKKIDLLQKWINIKGGYIQKKYLSKMWTYQKIRYSGLLVYETK